MAEPTGASRPQENKPKPEQGQPTQDSESKGADSEVFPTGWARGLAIAIFVAGVALALVVPETKPPFKAIDGFVLLTGFYIAAQAIERFLEFMVPSNGKKQDKANKAILMSAIAFVIAVVLCELLGLYLLQAVGVNTIPGNLDVIITALAIGGGTKPLHDFIKSIEKTKDASRADSNQPA